MIKIKNIDFRIVCIGLFVLSCLLRQKLLNSQFALINFISLFGILLIYLRSKRKFKTEEYLGASRQKFYLLYILTIICFISICILTTTMQPVDIFKYLFTTIVPILILFIPLSKEDTKRYVKIFSNFLLISCAFISICGILDFIVPIDISGKFVNFYKVASLYDMHSSNRMVSYLGHPLLTSEIMLICYSFNYLNNVLNGKRESNIKTIFCTLICFVGIILAGSKTGILLFVSLFLVLNVNLKNIKYVIVCGMLFYLIYSYGLLDIVINRFISGLASGDITTGRNSALAYLFSNNILNFKFLSGHAGVTLNESMIAALEYPILRWAYLFGGLFSLLMSTMIFIIPLMKIIKSSNYKIIAILIVLIIDVNTYNGITTQSDHMLIYCICIWLILHISYCLKGKRI